MTMSNPEDQKLATLAQNTMVRSNSKQAAALRDSTGRTYVAVNVVSPELTLDAFEAVLTVALASGITGVESVVIAGDWQGRVEVIKAFDPAATIFAISADGQERAL